jgi:hypothetical protein
MFVYGIRCDHVDADVLSSGCVEYNAGYGLLWFPAYTRSSVFNSHGFLTSRFWTDLQRVIENPTAVIGMSLEHPYITKGEDEVAQRIQNSCNRSFSWYYVPSATLPVLPALIVEESTTTQELAPSSVDDSVRPESQPQECPDGLQDCLLCQLETTAADPVASV